MDRDYDDWKLGDLIMWEDDPNYTNESRMFPITRFLGSPPGSFWVYWNDPATGEENMSRETNLVRVRKEGRKEGK